MGSREGIYNQPPVCPPETEVQQKRGKEPGLVSCKHLWIIVMAGTERGKTLFEQRIKGSLPTPFMRQERHYTHKGSLGIKSPGEHQPRGVLLLPEAFTSRSILAEGCMSTQRRVLTNQPGRRRAKQYDWSAAASVTSVTKSLQSCPTLCDPIDGSPPGSPVPGILQARILEWVAISFSNT